MKKIAIVVAAAGLISLAACKSPETTSALNNADVVADNLAAQADNLASETDNLTDNAAAEVGNAVSSLDNAADSIRAEAKAKAEKATK